MILFKSDWERFPSAIADYKTTNTSWLELAALYKEMGVENCDFHLALMQPALQGVDPYSPDLTTSQKEAIALEVEYNPWYYLREISRIPPVAGIEAVPFKANRANVSLVWCFLQHIDYLLIQPRQTGKSVSTDALTSWLYLCALRNSRMLLITKDDTLRADNVARLRQMRMFLPSWLIVDDRTDANNTVLVTYNTRQNKYRTAVGQNSEDAALKTGRGATVPVVHVDEGPFISFIDITLPAALSAGNAARDEAERNGLPYGNIYTTTAGKLDSRSGKYFYREVLQPSAQWTERFLDLSDKVAARKVIIKAGSGLAPSIVGQFSHRQLGYSDEWLFRKMAESKSHGAVADRDYFNRWTSGGLTSPLPNHITAAILQSERDPDHVEISKSGYCLSWYILENQIADFMRNNHVVIGVDTSNAIGRDGIAFVFLDQATMRPIATANINETYLIYAASWLAELMVKYKNTTLVIENKSSAQTFIDTCFIKLIGAGECPLERMFNRVFDNIDAHPNFKELLRKTPAARRGLDFYQPFRKYIGFMTTGSSRETLYGTVLTNAAKVAMNTISDKRLSIEIRSLEMKNGRIDHSASGHDDMVFAWMIAAWFYFHGKNLHMYGIDVSKFTVRIGGDGTTATPNQIAERAQQTAAKNKIEELTDKLKNTDSIHILMVIDAEIKRLSKRIGEVAEIKTIDSLIKDAKRERQSRLSQKNKYHRR